MSEMGGWTMVVGVAVAIAAISMLYTQVEQETRSAFEAVLQRIMARLEKQPGHATETVLERVSRAQDDGGAGKPERRAFPRRRLDDVFPSGKLRRMVA